MPPSRQVCGEQHREFLIGVQTGLAAFEIALTPGSDWQHVRTQHKQLGLVAEQATDDEDEDAEVLPAWDLLL